MEPSFVLRTETVARPLAAEPVATATVARTATAASRARRRDRALIGGPPGLVACLPGGRRRAGPIRWRRVGIACGNGDRRENDEGRPTRDALRKGTAAVEASYFSSTLPP